MADPVVARLSPTGVEVALRALADGEELPDEHSEWDDWGDGPRGPLPRDLGRLLVLADGEVVGLVTWHTTAYGASQESEARNIGIGLLPAARGRGIGWLAQRLLAEHLFATTDVFRVEASTDVENVAEQRSLEKAGFVREGVIRQSQVRRSGRHDLVGYSLLRTEL